MRLDVDGLIAALPFGKRRVHQIFEDTGFRPVSYHTTRKWAERGSIPVNRLLELLVAGKRQGCIVDLTNYVDLEGVKDVERQWSEPVFPRCGQPVRAGTADPGDSGCLATA